MTESYWLAIDEAAIRSAIASLSAALSSFGAAPGAQVGDAHGVWAAAEAAASRLARAPAGPSPATDATAGAERTDSEVANSIALCDGPGLPVVLTILVDDGELTSIQGRDASGVPLAVRRSGDGWMCVTLGERPQRRAVLPSGAIHDASAEALLARDPRATAGDVLDPVATLQRPPAPPPVPDAKLRQAFEENEAADAQVLADLQAAIGKIPAMFDAYWKWKESLKKEKPDADTFCGHCGARLPLNGEKCAKCGTPVPRAVPCAHCTRPLDPGTKFCTGCGHAVEKG